MSYLKHAYLFSILLSVVLFGTGCSSNPSEVETGMIKNQNELNGRFQRFATTVKDGMGSNRQHIITLENKIKSLESTVSSLKSKLDRINVQSSNKGISIYGSSDKNQKIRVAPQ